MRCVDLAGYVASSLVFMTFYMRGMIPLRLVALCSNVAFMVYGGALHLLPIVILHGALIPVNICRLFAACRVEGVNLPVVPPPQEGAARSLGKGLSCSRSIQFAMNFLASVTVHIQRAAVKLR